MAGTADKSINELEQWSPPAPAVDSYTASTCHRLRAKPIGEFSVEDLRIMVNTRSGLQWLMPVALELLEQDPLAEGDLGPLLCAVLGQGDDYWQANWEFRERAARIVAGLAAIPEEVEDQVSAFAATLRRIDAS